MKRTLLLIASTALLFTMAGASSHGGLLTPDHPLYSTKMAGEAGVEGLAPNASAEAEAKVKHAGKRANETRQLAEEGKHDLANDTANAYSEEMQEVNDLGSQISDLAQQQKIDELVAKATQHHAEVLSTVYDRVPEQARQGIERALNHSVKGYERATAAMEQRGQPTDGIGDISSRISSGVAEQAGIDLGSIGPGSGGGNTSGGPGGAGPR